MTKDIKLKQSTIETNKILEGTENYLNYCLLGAYFLIILMIIFKIFEGDSELLFPFVFVSSGFIVAGNIYSFKRIKENLRKSEANSEIEQLTNILSSEPKNADAYYLRGCAHKSLKAYRSAFHDLKNAEKFIVHLSGYLKETLNKDLDECQAGENNKKNS